MSEFQGGLPPRRTRKLERKKQQLSLKSLIQGGLVLFGTIFFGLIAWELYHANQEKEAVPTVSRAPASGKQTLKLEAGEQSAPAEREPSTDGQSNPAAETALAAQNEQTEQNAEAGQKTTSSGSAAQAQQRSSSMQPAVQAKDQPAAAPAPATDGKIVSPPAAKPQTEAKQQETKSRVKVVRHVVRKGETLFQLSRQYYGNNSGVARIARYNGLSPDTELVMGKVILIPLSQ